jgi:hypothetical protein
MVVVFLCGWKKPPTLLIFICAPHQIRAFYDIARLAKSSFAKSLERSRLEWDAMPATIRVHHRTLHVINLEQ